MPECPGGQDIILAHDLQQRCARQAGDQPQRIGDQGENRQHHMPGNIEKSGVIACDQSVNQAETGDQFNWTGKFKKRIDASLQGKPAQKIEKN